MTSPSTSTSCLISTNEVDEPLRSALRAATIRRARRRDSRTGPAVEVDTGVKEPAGGKREEPGGPLFAAEIGGPARAQELVAGARDLGEGADLDGKDEALQGAQDTLPVERARIPFLLVQIDVQMADDAVEAQRIRQRVHDDLAVLLRDLGLHLGKDAQKRAG